MSDSTPSGKKRLFVGFPVEVNSSLHASLKRTRIGAQQKDMEVYWIPETNFHVTLCFLGATPNERVDEIKQVLESLAAISPPIKTSLKGMGGFPDERHMRVLYVGVRKSRALSFLQDSLQTKLSEAGFPQEDREYQPHLTVARLRKSRSGTDLLSPYVRTSFGDISIHSIVLYESVLQGSHPTYKPLGTYELHGQETDLEEIME